jgi:type III pantothenate kinase
MLLAIDVGNTNICAGVFDGRGASGAASGAAPSTSLRIHTVPKKTEDEYSTIFRSILDERGVDPALIDRIVLSSVVPSLTEAIEIMCGRLFGIAPTTLGPAVYPKLPLKLVPDPHEIGSDLVADALAAWKRFGGACVVVDFGTALTLTCVGHDARILGVSIAPGLGTAVNALSRDTAQLPFVQLAAPPSVIGTNSKLSIQSGVVLGYVGLVEHLIGLIRGEIGGEVKVIATGGLCRTMAGLTRAFDAVDVDLTLNGLALVAEYL